MKAPRLGSLFLVLGLAACSSEQPNVYALPQADAVARLAAVTVKPSGSAAFGEMALRASKKGTDAIVWDASGNRNKYRCDLVVAPADKGGSRVGISCDGSFPAAGAGAGLVKNALRNRAIELVDATLEDRPFDPQLAEGATARGWPENGADFGSVADAAKQAVEMHEAARAAQ